jgi:hypothetical protein
MSAGRVDTRYWLCHNFLSKMNKNH